MNWTREFIDGMTVFMIRPRVEEFNETAELVGQLIRGMLPGEEIRIQPKRKTIGHNQPGGEAGDGLTPWEAPSTS